eukprot:739909-Prorocentrum_minimum.AAC.1
MRASGTIATDLKRVQRSTLLYVLTYLTVAHELQLRELIRSWVRVLSSCRCLEEIHEYLRR